MKITSLAKLMRNHHKHTGSWPNTGRAYGISGGMAYRIAIHRYEPAAHSTRKLLGLDDRPCPKCGYKANRKSRAKSPKPDFITTWEHLPKEERHKVIKQYLKWREENE